MFAILIRKIQNLNVEKSESTGSKKAHFLCSKTTTFEQREKKNELLIRNLFFYRYSNSNHAIVTNMLCGYGNTLMLAGVLNLLGTENKKRDK